MKMTIFKKLICSYGFMAFLVVITGVAALFVINNVARSGDVVAHEQVPIKTVSTAAVISAQQIMNTCREYLLAESGLEKLEKKIHSHMDEFDMYIAIVEYGTESEKFKKSPAEKLKKKKNINIIVPAGNNGMQDVIKKIKLGQQSVRKKVQEFITLHQKKMEYSFTFQDVSYTLPAFLYSEDIHNRKWIEALGNTVNYEEPFTEATNPEECSFIKWHSTFSISDKVLSDMLSNMMEQLKKIHIIADRIVKTNNLNTRPLLFRNVKKLAPSIQKDFSQLEQYTTNKLKVLDNEEKIKLEAMFQAYDQMIVHLKAMEKIADNGMDQAVNQAAISKIKARWVVSILIGSAVIMALSFGYFIANSITSPLIKAVGMSKDMAKGDFTKTIVVNSKDETSILADALNNMAADLNTMFRDIIAGAETLFSSSESLTTLSRQMSKGAGQTSEKSNTVAAAAEEMSSNMTSVALASEESSSNMNTVATAAEEMSVTVDEIAKNSESARMITTDAVNQTQRAKKNVDDLGEAAKGISKVTEVITDISDQINLLALNATIEAARAGESGKGFVVVANEIKDLARRTSEAISEIKQNINNIQSSTDVTINEILEIAQIINNVNDIVSTIATSVEEQSYATQEITRNVMEASEGIVAVNENVIQSSKVSGDIAHEIADVNQASSEISGSSSFVSDSAEELKQLANQLKTMTEKIMV